MSAVSRQLRVTIRDLAPHAEVVRAVHSGSPATAGSLEVHAADDRALELQAQSAVIPDAGARADLLARATKGNRDCGRTVVPSAHAVRHSRGAIAPQAA